MAYNAIMTNQPLIIDGARTPFMRSGGKFNDLSSRELGNFAVNGLLNKLDLEPSNVQYACMGTVIADPDTPNVAREIVLMGLLSQATPAHTVSMACISSNIATTTIAEMIRSGHILCGIAGGVETFSDIPIRFSKNLRQVLLHIKKKKTLAGKLKLLSHLHLGDLKPDIPSPKEFSTGFTMGEAGDQLAAQFGISRKDADTYALESHRRAADAWLAGHYKDQVIPIASHDATKDDGPRPDSTPDMLARLHPAFDRFGVNTAANSSFFSDGGSAIMLGSRAFCQQQGIHALASIKDYIYSGSDPLSELLLGPALTVPYLLKRNDLKVSDIDVWEIHEAFAGQVLAILKAMSSADFCQKRLGLDQPLSDIPMDLINRWGGSLSLGHPFGATGTRLILTAAQRLVAEDGKLAVVTGCAASGLGSAILLARVNS